MELLISQEKAKLFMRFFFISHGFNCQPHVGRQNVKTELSHFSIIKSDGRWDLNQSRRVRNTTNKSIGRLAFFVQWGQKIIVCMAEKAEKYFTLVSDKNFILNITSTRISRKRPLFSACTSCNWDLTVIFRL